MVLYYSATGNTEYIAQEIAKRLDDECIDLLPRIKNHDYSNLHSEKPFIICAPVVETIQSGNKLKARHIFLFETIITLPFNPVWCKYKLLAKDFYSTDACIGCGKCVKLCPLNNITSKDKAPVWGDHCTHCMACIGNCPTRAIEYGKITQEKEQYNFGKYHYVVDNLSKKRLHKY